MTVTALKPMLAEDWVPEKQAFPVILQPKFDGVRTQTLNGPARGRSLKAHANKYTTARYSVPELKGLDGEMIIGDDPYREHLCHLTTGALNTIVGTPRTTWHLFDLWDDHTMGWGYMARYAILQERLEQLKGTIEVANDLSVVESVLCKDMDELLTYETKWCKAGAEGAILRAPNGMLKQGRVTVTEGTLLRIKRFIEEDAIVVGYEEGRKNLNKAQVNELGLQFRSAHKANTVPNGMIGSLICRTVKDACDPHTGKVVLPADTDIVVSPGKMTEKECRYYFENPDKLLNQVIKYRFFPKGMKDKPRFPQFYSFRAPSDI